MNQEHQVKQWWDALTPEQRIQRANELGIWRRGDDWSRNWSELKSDKQRLALQASLAEMFSPKDIGLGP